MNLYLSCDLCICFLVQGPFVAAGDIRRRLSESLSAPQALFKRDPEDPSGRFELSDNVILNVTLQQKIQISVHIFYFLYFANVTVVIV